MEKKELTCIGCPLGCSISVHIENNEVADVSGNTCPRGDAYARKEITDPRRMVTSSVMVDGGKARMVSCKTKEDIPKGKISDVILALKTVHATAPVHIGDILLSNAAQTGVDIVATKNVDAI